MQSSENISFLYLAKKLNHKRERLTAIKRMMAQNANGMMAGSKPSQAVPRSDSGNSSKVSRVSSFKDLVKMGDVDEQRRAREAEKAEKVMHLIFWGPK